MPCAVAGLPEPSRGPRPRRPQAPRPWETSRLRSRCSSKASSESLPVTIASEVSRCPPPPPAFPMSSGSRSPGPGLPQLPPRPWPGPRRRAARGTFARRRAGNGRLPTSSRASGSTSSSSRPTPPGRCTPGAAVGWPVGDAIANLSRHKAPRSTAEYYLNDRRQRQLDVCGASLLAAHAAKSRPKPATHLPVHRRLVRPRMRAEIGDEVTPKPRASGSTTMAVRELRDRPRPHRRAFDTWFSERVLHDVTM